LCDFDSIVLLLTTCYRVTLMTMLIVVVVVVYATLGGIDHGNDDLQAIVEQVEDDKRQRDDLQDALRRAEENNSAEDIEAISDELLRLGNRIDDYEMFLEDDAIALSAIETMSHELVLLIVEQAEDDKRQRDDLQDALRRTQENNIDLL